MFTIHTVEGDKSKVLVEASTDILMVLMAAWGESRTHEIKSMLMRWGLTEFEAGVLEGKVFKYDYTNVKAQIINAHRRYLDSEDK